jgi:3D (Asp-Asp-Asp) domain-containing protein
VGGRRRRSAARIAGFSAVLVLLAGSAAAAAGPRAHGQAASLRTSAHALGTREHAALLGLYSLDTRLRAAQAQLAALQQQELRLRAEQALLAQQIAATRHTLVASEALLADNLRTLYKQGDVNALGVVLGAQSLDDAMTKLDDLRSVADQSRRVVRVTTNATIRLTRLRATLATQRARVDAAVASAAQTTRTLATARASRVSFIADLRRQERLRAEQIAALDAAARRSAQKSQQLQAAAVGAAAAASDAAPAVTTTEAPAPTHTAAPAQPAAPATGRTITVTSTGYSLPGRTATGLPVGWGIVAVDPSVIPLGTRLTIPGYGEGVAADTGGGVRGAMIDLWFPTLAQARGWGRRTVTITLH